MFKESPQRFWSSATKFRGWSPGEAHQTSDLSATGFQGSMQQVSKYSRSDL